MGGGGLREKRRKEGKEEKGQLESKETNEAGSRPEARAIRSLLTGRKDGHLREHEATVDLRENDMLKEGGGKKRRKELRGDLDFSFSNSSHSRVAPDGHLLPFFSQQ